MKHFDLLRLAALLMLLVPAATSRAQNVGIGTISPTQTLDVNGALRVRNLSGEGLRLPQVQADGTLGVNAAPFSTAPVGGTLAEFASTGTNGSPVAVVANGTMAYVVTSTNRLQIFDASNPTAFGSAVGSAATQSSPMAVAVNGTTAYVVSQPSATAGSLQVYDVSIPTRPVLLNATNPSQSNGTATRPYPVAVAVSGTIVYVLCKSLGNSGEIQAFDVSNPAAPALIGSNRGSLTAANPIALAVSGNKAGVISSPSASAAGVLQIYDISAPSSIVLLTTSPTQTDLRPTDIAMNGSTAYVVNNSSATAGTLQVFDVSSASPVLLNPTRTGGFTGGTATGINPTSVAVSGTNAYLVTRNSTGPSTPAGSLQVYDASTPANPMLRNPATAGGTTGGTPTSDDPVGVAVSGTTTYVISQNTTKTTGSIQVFVNSLGLGQLVTVNPDGSLASVSAAVLPGDNLGNHTATQQLALANGGLKFADGTTQTTASVGDNLGTHTASQNLNLASYQLVGNGGSQGLAISSSGQVEMGGQAAPTLLLHSNSNDQLAGGTLQFRENSTNYGWNLRHNTGGSEGGSTNDRLILERVNGVAPSPTMTWDQNTGNVGIGTTAPGAALDVAGTVRATAFANTSDARLKQQVRPLAGALAAVQALRGVRYTWNARGVQRGGVAGAEQVGMLAQELEKVYPELVSTDAQGYKAVNYAQLTPVLIEALKELAARNEALQSRVADQQASLSSFEQRLRALEAGGGQARK